MKNFKFILWASLVAAFFSGCYMTKKSTEYYGIETGTSNKIVYVLDISGSMEGKAEKDLQGNIVSTAASKTGNFVGNKIGGQLGNLVKKQTNNQLTKLGKAKKELMPAIRGLSEDKWFTIIVFENRVKKWRKNLVQATSANKNLAIAYLENLHSGGGTNLSDALEEAFQLAGSGATDANAELGVETIFLLSDGSPTAGKITNTNQILEEIGKWNSAQRVKIHTIGLGEDCDKDFMKKIAEQNSGQFIDK
ncbi:MAG: VWA domain-containing protein [Bacteroidales bacterium]|nr:VWA domain-containing protein [Bacteroidales bacterium]